MFRRPNGQWVFLFLVWDDFGDRNVAVEDNDMFACPYLSQFLADMRFEVGYICGLHMTIISLERSDVKIKQLSSPQKY